MTCAVNFVERRNEPLTKIMEFYESQGYEGGAKEDDTIFLAYMNGEIVCVVRVVIEWNTAVLRGMYVKNEFRGFGIGRDVLTALKPFLEKLDKPCFCISKTHLVQFYGLVGFQPIERKIAPSFLQERYNLYLSKGFDVVLMNKSNSQ